MAKTEVRDMQGADEYFVSTCSHVNESAEIDACGQRSLTWLRAMHSRGLRAKVALLDGQHAGFAFLIPIEICPCTMTGREVMVMPCLWVIKSAKGNGAGRALLAAAEQETQQQGRKALATVAFYSDFWFMPAAFFEKMGFTVARREGKDAILWKVYDPSAEAPGFLKGGYEFTPVPGKVVVDLFHFSFCLTVGVEAQRVREVAGEFGDRVVLNEHCADDQDVLLRCRRPRGIFINGKEIGWGYEAPRDGIRKAIAEALAATQQGA